MEETSVSSQMLGEKKSILFQKKFPDGKASYIFLLEKGEEKKKTEAKEGQG